MHIIAAAHAAGGWSIGGVLLLAFILCAAIGIFVGGSRKVFLPLAVVLLVLVALFGAT